MSNYILSGTRPFTLPVVKAWYKGETENILRFFSPFKNTIFVSKGGMVSMYYDKALSFANKHEKRAIHLTGERK